MTITTDPLKNATSKPPAWHAHGTSTTTRRIPFQGTYRITSWSGQGLAAFDLDKQKAQFQQPRRICQHSDIVCIQETGTTKACAAAWNPPRGSFPYGLTAPKLPPVQTFRCSTHIKDFDDITPASVHQIQEGRALSIKSHRPMLGTLQIINA